MRRIEVSDPNRGGILGHASILTTQLYTHVSRKKFTQVYNDTHPSAQGGSGLFD